jgi:cell division protein ZapA
MGQVVVEIGGRSYMLSCRDGDESHLTELASGIAKKADGLTQSLGPMSEARLLLMAALMVADELEELRLGKMPSWMPAHSDSDPATTERLAALLARTERLATSLDS